MLWPFIPNRRYRRASELHGVFAGNSQGGVVPLAGYPGIFLFTGAGGKAANYSDRFMPDGTFRYTGEGQVGPMKMIRGNRAIRDHVLTGRDLLLFEKVGTTPFVKYLGQFVADGYEVEVQPDRSGAPRDAFVFKLVPIEAFQVQEQADLQPGATLFSDLRKRAYDAASPTAATSGGAPRTIYVRSAEVRSYVIARAAGVCEGCDEPAPFTTSSGAPFLEAHHIDRLSDGGLDLPDRVAGICPNCHRRAHHSADASAFNTKLRQAIASKEAALSD